ncbi:hypothetical protein [Anaeromicrobium sediminis]|uniref:Glycerophosphoryl diester phosphodiesterase membrane domain-containing protein n=1 Tax=Anaeromicrobium sediminis TaxID=1478221 RepID=A0A267MJF5_9FIRM|nr:hypothetical protein [Anaeromicrobium sediminis]PAB59666.1 hypothetical protein CCE28_08860 [Anaeromicrobium sediminis]
MDLRGRVLDIGEIFSYAFNVFKDKFKTISAIMLSIYVPINVFFGMAIFSSSSEMLTTSMLFMTPIAGIVTGILGVAGTVGVIYVVESYLVKNEDLPYKEAFSRAFSIIGSSILLAIAGNFLIFIGMILLIIPGIAIAIYIVFKYQSMALRGTKVLESLSYSKNVVSGSWWKILFVNIICGLLALVVTSPFNLIGDSMIGYIIVQSVNAIVMSFTIIVNTVMFLNLDFIKNEKTDTFLVDEHKNDTLI